MSEPTILRHLSPPLTPPDRVKTITSPIPLPKNDPMIKNDKSILKRPSIRSKSSFGSKSEPNPAASRVPASLGSLPGLCTRFAWLIALILFVSAVSRYRPLLKYLILLVLLSTLAMSVNAQISGSVFRYFNGNGSKEANEPLLPGVTVNAFDSSNVIIASYKSAGATAPNYTIPNSGPAYNNTPGSNTGSVAAAAAVRVEFVFPSASACVQAGIDYSSFAGTANGTSAQFATGSSTDVNFAVHNPSDSNQGTSDTTTLAVAVSCCPQLTIVVS
jgi:hypothetical protein